MRDQALPSGSDWTFDAIELYYNAIEKTAVEYGLGTYPNQIEIITSEQMIDAYASVGMPVGYNHWSFGRKFIQFEKNYRRGQMGLAYEIVINSNPCISYLMEENTLPMQALVIAHACFGHNSFFKNNYLFKTWTNPDSIIDYLIFSKSYISSCEEKYGLVPVEDLLDSCHALLSYGVDRYKRPQKLSLREEKEQQKSRENYLQSQINDLWLSTVPSRDDKVSVEINKFPLDPEENLLYFFEKHSPFLETWQREIIRIVRKISQYFYPQKQTQVMNEGWASFWHYTLLNSMYDRGLLSDKFMFEFLHSHTSVIYQPDYNSNMYSGINPYALGFSMFSDIKRICLNPTAEDKYFFPNFAGSKNWMDTINHAMMNFKDESFISQYLSPEVMRKFKLFSVLDDSKEDSLLVSAIHNDDGYLKLRSALSKQYNLSYSEPDIQVTNVDIRGDRSLTLTFTSSNKSSLSSSRHEMLKHIHRLWGFNIFLVEKNAKGEDKLISSCPV